MGPSSPDRPLARQLAIRPVGGRVVISKRRREVLSSARRVDQSGVRSRAGQAERDHLTGNPNRRPRPCSLRKQASEQAVGHCSPPPVCLPCGSIILNFLVSPS